MRVESSSCDIGYSELWRSAASDANWGAMTHDDVLYALQFAVLSFNTPRDTATTRPGRGIYNKAC
jgi:hypothetical protein